MEYFGHNTMSCTMREHFLAWFDESKSQPFDFQKEMLGYCRSDVDILLHQVPGRFHGY